MPLSEASVRVVRRTGRFAKESGVASDSMGESPSAMSLRDQ